MAISLSSQNPHKSFQLAKLSRQSIGQIVAKTVSLLGITTVVLCQIPTSQAQPPVSQVSQAHSLANQLRLTKLVVSGVDKLKNGDYDGAIAAFRQVSNAIPRQDSTATMFASYEQMGARRRSTSQQAATIITKQEFQRLRLLLFLSNRIAELKKLPSRFTPIQNYRGNA
ncbi:hypothetical protein [Pseudanabaena sp. PCC 6802]|uniref:hypothetical protein n=1 Tax=Pseudanabaena sp. PCC 6802 TaxID=118173 RepID=UPI00034DFA36|nr:hypothetical protein [Pseudanabaena sp. PCC 6802]